MIIPSFDIQQDDGYNTEIIAFNRYDETVIVMEQIAEETQASDTIIILTEGEADAMIEALQKLKQYLPA